jgi:hypothetical protein
VRPGGNPVPTYRSGRNPEMAGEIRDGADADQLDGGRGIGEVGRFLGKHWEPGQGERYLVY